MTSLNSFCNPWGCIRYPLYFKNRYRVSYQSHSLLIGRKHLFSFLVSVGIVHEEQIDVLQSQLLQGVFAVGHDVLRVVLVVPELATDEELLPRKINIGTLNLAMQKTFNSLMQA